MVICGEIMGHVTNLEILLRVKMEGYTPRLNYGSLNVETNDLRLTTISNKFLGDPMFRRTHPGYEMVDQVFRLVNLNWEKQCFAIYPRETLG